jgi:hypothetical protein
MAWEVRFFLEERAVSEARRDAPCPFQAESDALTHGRFLLHRALEGCVEVFHREARRRVVYRLRGGRMVALVDPPWPTPATAHPPERP